MTEPSGGQACAVSTATASWGSGTLELAEPLSLSGLWVWV